MKRILDTNVCIDVLRGRNKVVDRPALCRPKECFISVATEWGKLIGIDRSTASRLLRGERKLNAAHVHRTHFQLVSNFSAPWIATAHTTHRES